MRIEAAERERRTRAVPYDSFWRGKRLAELLEHARSLKIDVSTFRGQGSETGELVQACWLAEANGDPSGLPFDVFASLIGTLESKALLKVAAEYQEVRARFGRAEAEARLRRDEQIRMAVERRAEDTLPTPVPIDEIGASPELQKIAAAWIAEAPHFGVYPVGGVLSANMVIETIGRRALAVEAELARRSREGAVAVPSKLAEGFAAARLVAGRALLALTEKRRAFNLGAATEADVHAAVKEHSDAAGKVAAAEAALAVAGGRP